MATEPKVTVRRRTIGTGSRSKPRAVKDIQGPEGTIGMSKQEAKVLEKVVKEKVSPGTAVVDAGYAVPPGPPAEKLGLNILKKHEKLNPEYIDALREKITPEMVCRVLEEALVATKFVKTSATGYDEVPDHAVRMAALDQFRDVIGLKAPKQIESTELTLEQILIRIAIEDGRDIDMGM